MLIKSAENPSHFYHLSSFSNRTCSACLTQIARLEACYNSHTDSDIWHATKNKRSNVLNLPKQSQVCPSLILSFQFKMRISVIYGPLNVSWKCVVSVLSPLASNSCGRSHIGTQKLHWDKTNKVNYHLKLCMPFVGLDHSATFASQYAGFVPREWKPAKGLLYRSVLLPVRHPQNVEYKTKVNKKAKLSEGK